MPSAMNAIIPQIASSTNSAPSSSSSASSSSSKGSFASTLASCTQSQNSATAQGSSSTYNSPTNDPAPTESSASPAQQQPAPTKARATTSDTNQTNQGTTTSTATAQSTVNGQSKTDGDKDSQQDAATQLAPGSQTPVSVYGLLAAVAAQVAVQKTTASATNTVAVNSQQGVDSASAVEIVGANTAQTATSSGQPASLSSGITQQSMTQNLLQQIANQTEGKGQNVANSGIASDAASMNTNAAGLANAVPSAGSPTSDTALTGLTLTNQTGVASAVQESLSTTLQVQTPLNIDKNDVVAKTTDLFGKGQNEAVTHATDLSKMPGINTNAVIGQNAAAATDLSQNGQNTASASVQSAGNSTILSAAQVLADKLTVTKQTTAQSTGTQTGVQENSAAANHDPLAELTAIGAQTSQQTLSDHSQNSFGLKEDGAESLLASHKEEGNSASATESVNFSQILGSENSSIHPESVSTASTSEAATSKDSFQVVQQIIDQAKLVTGDQSNEMIIKLKPEHLGELTLKVTVEQGLVTATFHSGNSDVRAAIESSLPQLKQELANSGLKVDNVGVYTSLNQFMSNQQQSQQPQQQAKIKFSGKSRSEAAESFEEEVQSLTEVSATGGSDGVDYLI